MTVVFDEDCGVQVVFTDGSWADPTKDGAAAMRGKHLDQIQRIELHPSGGGIAVGRRGDGVTVRMLKLDLPGLPCPVFVAFDVATAATVGRQLSGDDPGAAVPIFRPGDLPRGA